MESLLMKKGEIIYEKNKEEWEKLYLEKIIAIEVDSQELAAIGDKLDEVSKKARKKFPDKPFYFRKVGPCRSIGFLFTIIGYKENQPLVEITIKGPRGQKTYYAYLDTGSGMSLIPEKDAIELGLDYSGDFEIITGSGKDSLRLFPATISFLNRDFDLTILGRDLPEQAPIKALIGRDILDHYKVSFNGIDKKVEIIIDNP